MKRKEKKERRSGGFEFDYSDETLKRFMRSSAEWKLKWLEEMNRLTDEALTRDEKKIRERIRRGEI
ncbi:MAG: hypothetical protein AB1742_05590 [bacterium]